LIRPKCHVYRTFYQYLNATYPNNFTSQTIVNIPAGIILNSRTRNTRLRNNPTGVRIFAGTRRRTVIITVVVFDIFRVFYINHYPNSKTAISPFFNGVSKKFRPAVLTRNKRFLYRKRTRVNRSVFNGTPPHHPEKGLIGFQRFT